MSFEMGDLHRTGQDINDEIVHFGGQAESVFSSLAEQGRVLIQKKADELAAQYLESNPKYLEAIKDFVDNGYGSLSTSNILDLERKINDIPKLTKAAQEYGKRLKQYYDNPGKLQSELDKITEEQAKEIKENVSAA